MHSLNSYKSHMRHIWEYEKVNRKTFKYVKRQNFSLNLDTYLVAGRKHYHQSCKRHNQ